jgi:hypothetical protein
MYSIRNPARISWILLLIGAVGIGCSAPPPQAPPPAAVPAVAPPPPPPVEAAHNPDQDWNIFPDPTTGTIDIYHKGEYVGVITGNEPVEQDPPLPHRPDEPDDSR